MPTRATETYPSRISQILAVLEISQPTRRPTHDRHHALLLLGFGVDLVALRGVAIVVACLASAQVAMRVVLTWRGGPRTFWGRHCRVQSVTKSIAEPQVEVESVRRVSVCRLEG